MAEGRENRTSFFRTILLRTSAQPSQVYLPNGGEGRNRTGVILVGSEAYETPKPTNRLPLAAEGEGIEPPRLSPDCLANSLPPLAYLPKPVFHWGSYHPLNDLSGLPLCPSRRSRYRLERLPRIELGLRTWQVCVIPSDPSRMRTNTQRVFCHITIRTQDLEPSRELI